MEIKSSLLNDEDFSGVKRSLIDVSEIDGKQNFRVKLIEYINDTADNSNDMFFYDMLEFVRFLKPTSKSIAYTTPERLIYMNAPGEKIGEKARQWDFVYCHECLHQLWDTFAVGDKIKKEGVKYDHKLLNIASDIVINDYLAHYRKKDQPSMTLTPEWLKEKYGIEYDRRADTQYTLYLKLLEKIEELKKDPNYQNQPEEDEQEGEGGGSGDDSNDSDNKNGKGGNQNKGDDNKDGNQDGDQNGSSKGDDKDGDQEGSESAEGSDGDGEEDKDADKDGAGSSKDGDQGEKKDGSKADSNANKDGSSSDGKEDKEAAGKKAGKGEGSDTITSSIKKKADAIIEKYRNKISGDFGNFIKQCKSSLSMSKSGLSTSVTKGGASWNTQLSNYVNAFVKKKVFQKKRQYESTYSRVKRGSGFVEFGKPIMPGKKVKEEKLTIDVAFYIDRSGSMSGSIEDVFDACYTIAESLKKQFAKEKVVDDVTFKLFAFNESMKELKYGNRINASGGTMSFDSIVNFISKNTKEFLVNIIITDAEFDVNADKVKGLMKDINGMVSFVTNNDNATVKKLANEFKNKLYYILANADFSI